MLPASILKQLCLKNCNQANYRLAWGQSFWNWLRLVLRMLYYEISDIIIGIDPTKNNNSKECMICHY